MRKIILAFVMCAVLALCTITVSCSCDSEDTEHEHVWGTGKVIKDSTQTEYGLMEFACQLCSATTNRVIARKDHTHSFAEEWKSDRMAHWHVCTVFGCTVLGSREEHKWDDGEIITEANQMTSGTKKYKCTVCAYEKEERYAAKATVSNVEWLDAFKKENFENVTVVYTRTQNGYTNSVTSKISNGKIEYTDESGRICVIDDVAGASLGSHSLSLRLEFMKNSFQHAIYDTNTRAYLFDVNGRKGSVQFSDGKITAFSIVQEGGKTEKYEMSAYARTEITE